MYKDCLKRCFYHLKDFDLFGNRSCKLKYRTILGNDVFISDIASRTCLLRVYTSEPFPYRKLLGDLFKCQKLQKCPLGKRKGLLFPVCETVMSMIVEPKFLKQFNSVPKTYFTEDYRWVPLIFDLILGIL